MIPDLVHRQRPVVYLKELGSKTQVPALGQPRSDAYLHSHPRHLHFEASQGQGMGRMDTGGGGWIGRVVSFHSSLFPFSFLLPWPKVRVLRMQRP